MTTSALIILHPGFEEIEAITPIDLLTRAGVDVTIAGLNEAGLVTGKNGVQVQTEITLAAVAEQSFDAVVLPGGPGIFEIRKHPELCQCLQAQAARNGLIGCICAAPLLLLDAGLIGELQYTAFPATKDELPNAQSCPVVVDGKFVTSRGAGTATEFGLALIEQLLGTAKSAEIAESICWPHN